VGRYAHLCIYYFPPREDRLLELLEELEEDRLEDEELREEDLEDRIDPEDDLFELLELFIEDLFEFLEER
jgi:hypothetical protein